MEHASICTQRSASMAPWAAHCGGSMGHEFPAPHPTHRTCHQQDRDRILHCEAFRRLGYKTQVFVIHEGDFYRTRLTHSLEVAQIARGIACALGANEDLCEAVSYAHDLGHPPFGHRGEEALDELLAAFLDARLGLARPPEGKAFEQNFQSFRVVSRLERRYLDFPGLNLTAHTVEGILRHTTAFDTPVVPYPVALSDPVLAGRGAACMGEGSAPGAEAQIVNAADQIAWATHDLEDALRVRFLRPGELLEETIPLLHEATERMGGNVDPKEDSVVWGRMLIRNLIDLLITDIVAESRSRLADVGGAEALRSSDVPYVAFSEAIRESVESLRMLLIERVYTHPVVERMSYKAVNILSRMFETLTKDILEADSMSARLLPAPTRRRLDEAEHAAGKALVVADFLAGMTDRFASEFYRVLYQPDERSITSLY